MHFGRSENLYRNYSHALSHKVVKEMNTGQLVRSALSQKNKSTASKIKAFDKEHLLEEILNEKVKNTEVLEENNCLKFILSRGTHMKKERNITENQFKLMIDSLKTENEVLMRKFQQKSKLLKESKQSSDYTRYLEIITQYQSCKEEAKRLRLMAKEKRRERNVRRRQNRRITAAEFARSKEMCQLCEDKMSIIYDLEEQIQLTNEQLAKIGNKNRHMERDYNKLMEEVNQLAANRPNHVGFGPNAKIKSQNSKQYDISIFNQAVVLKSSAPDVVPEVEEPNTTEDERSQNLSCGTSEKEMSSRNSNKSLEKSERVSSCLSL